MTNYIFPVRPSKGDISKFTYQLNYSQYVSEMDLREWDSPVQDQGQAGSCVSNALTNSYELMVRDRYPDKFTELSRLFVYYNSRVIEESVESDIGILHIKDSLDAIKHRGICSEDLWPYDIEKLTVKPGEECYADALKRSIIDMRHITSLRGIIESINDKKPVTIGMEVYQGFMIADKTHSTIPMPELNEQFLGSLGGHSVNILGYSLPRKKFLIKNSFGTKWGDSGYAWLTFEYVNRYAFERWCFDISDQTTLIEQSPMTYNTCDNKTIGYDVT